MLVDTRRESNVLSGAAACIDMDAGRVSAGRRVGDQAGRGGSDEDAEEDSGADDGDVEV
jgi:hypothetical protein